MRGIWSRLRKIRSYRGGRLVSSSLRQSDGLASRRPVGTRHLENALDHALREHRDANRSRRATTGAFRLGHTITAVRCGVVHQLPIDFSMQMAANLRDLARQCVLGGGLRMPQVRWRPHGVAAMHAVQRRKDIQAVLGLLWKTSDPHGSGKDQVSKLWRQRPGES